MTNYPITIQFDDQASDILPNMSATANIILDTKVDVLTVPAAAVSTSTNGDTTVQVMVNNAPQIKTVQTGISSDSDIEIVSGVNEGDTVVTGTVSKTTTTASSTTSVFGGLRTTGGGGFSGASLGGSGSATRTRTGG